MKDTVKNKIERQATDWEKYFTKHLSHKGLKTRIHKELFQQNNNKTTQFLKWTKESNRYFINEDVRRAIRHMKVNASQRVTRQTQMKTSETPLYPLEWLEFKQLKTPSVQEVPGQLEFSPAGENAEIVRPLWKTL